MDFTQDSLSTGRQFRTLNLIDAFTRECLLIEADHSLTGPRVVRALERLKELYGKPEVIRIDNGTEFTRSAVDTDRERPRRKLQRQAPRRVPQPELVHQPRRRPQEGQGVPGRARSGRTVHWTTRRRRSLLGVLSGRRNVQRESGRLRAELDAVFFHLHGVSHDEADCIFEALPIVKKNGEKAHGEYRTKRVILEVYDAMADAIRTDKPYQTRLDPPPANPRVAHPPHPEKV
jgi:hypothetical protein